MGFNILVTHWLSTHLPHFFTVAVTWDLPSLNSPFPGLGSSTDLHRRHAPSLPRLPPVPAFGAGFFGGKKTAPGSLPDFSRNFWLLGGKDPPKIPQKPMKFTVLRNSSPLKILCFECQRDGGFKYCVVFHPENWGRFPFWLIFSTWAETTNCWWKKSCTSWGKGSLSQFLQYKVLYIPGG